MTERIFIGVAWPYANGPLHLGHIAGCYLPADIFARYHRLAGHEVLMVSGSDQHGTPIVVRAEEEGMTPEEVANRYHHEFLDSWNRLGISFDLYTTTGTTNHSRIVQDVFNRLQQRGYLREATMPVVYCPGCRRYLPDRFVEGALPALWLGANARGDQCAGLRSRTRSERTRHSTLPAMWGNPGAARSETRLPSTLRPSRRGTSLGQPAGPLAA